MLQSSREHKSQSTGVAITSRIRYCLGHESFNSYSPLSPGRSHSRKEWNGMCCSGQRPSAGTSKVIQHRQKERKKKLDRTRRKHPTKLVKAAACCLLSPLTTTTGWILRGTARKREDIKYKNKYLYRRFSLYVCLVYAVSDISLRNEY